MDKKLKEIIMRLSATNSVALFTHVFPDGDALGSQLALAETLKSLGKTVHCYNTTPIPERYNFLPIESIELFSRDTIQEETVVLLDCGFPARAGLNESLAYDDWIIIDHHETSRPLENLHWIVPTAPATCSLVFDLIKAWEQPLTETMATALYTGLSTDTGSFKYASVTPHTLNQAAELLACGADFNRVRKEMYESTSRSRFALLQYLYGHAEFFSEGKGAYVVVPYAFSERVGAKNIDFEGLANLLKEVDGVEVGFLIRELKDGQCKANLRGKEWLPLHEIAEQFGGGGHARAAGITTHAYSSHQLADELKQVIDTYMRKKKECTAL